MIEFKNINVVFNAGTKLEKQVLKNLNLKIADGEFVVTIGGNGAGKSTIMNVLSGEIVPKSGAIFIDNIEVTKFTTENRAGMIARVFQDLMIGTFTDLTIEENMSLATYRGKKKGLALSLNNQLRDWFKSMLQELDMGLENRLQDKVVELSGGQRQALSLIMATLQNAKVLLLDEHTAALDPKTGKLIMEMTAKIVHKHKLTTLMVTHSIEQALQYGSRLIIMQQGHIVRDIADKERKILSSQDLIECFV